MKHYNEYFDMKNNDMRVYLENQKEAMLVENQIERLAYGFSLVKGAVIQKFKTSPESREINISGFDSLVMSENEHFYTVWNYEKGREFTLEGITAKLVDFTLPESDNYVFTYEILGESNEI